MKLFIDSTDNLKTIIRLDGKEYTKTYSSPRQQDIFAFLMEALDKHHASVSDVTQIEVNPGPGSFTGSRLGVAIANALSFALGVPVNQQKPPVKPVYSQQVTWKEANSKKKAGNLT